METAESGELFGRFGGRRGPFARHFATMHEILRTIAAVRRISDAGRRGILVTIVSTSGSTYRRAGARAVISEDGDVSGTISGGCVERDLAERTAKWLDKGVPQLVRYDSTKTEDIIFGSGLGCRGEIELLVEPFWPGNVPRLITDFRWNGRQPVEWTTTFDGHELLVEKIAPERAIVVFGGGPDVEPVARLAQDVGWRAVTLSPRDVHPEEVSDRIDLALFDAAIVMTHNFLHDATLLSLLFPTSVPFIGLLGPRTRGDELLAHIGSKREEWGDRLHTPLGLDLGGEMPEEIALSIVAEVQAALNRRDGKPLREVAAPIHARGDVVCR